MKEILLLVIVVHDFISKLDISNRATINAAFLKQIANVEETILVWIDICSQT